MSNHHTSFYITRRHFSHIFQNSNFNRIHKRRITNTSSNSMKRSNIFRETFPTTTFRNINRQISLTHRCRLTKLTLPTSSRHPRSRPHLITSKRRPITLLTFQFSRPRTSLMVTKTRPIKRFYVKSRTLRLPRSLSSIRAISNNRLFKRSNRSFNLSRTNLRRSIPRRTPRFTIIINVYRITMFTALKIRYNLHHLNQLSKFRSLNNLQLMTQQHYNRHQIQ